MKIFIIIFLILTISLPVNANNEATADKISHDVANKAIDYPTEQRILFAHDYLVNTVEYDYDYNKRSYKSYGALVDGLAVCQGYAFAFKDILDHMEIENNICIGSVGGEAHSWNVVCVDYRWYYVDVTFDDSSKSYDYFMNTFKRCDFVFELD